jgi:putative toxin-antitoxin system antitoxin component (TIGR02293 family)
MPTDRQLKSSSRRTRRVAGVDIAVRKVARRAQHPNDAAVKLIGIRCVGPIELDAEVKKGFACTTYERLLNRTKVQPSVLAEVIGVSPRTLHRRKGGRLRRQESDRLLRFSRLFAQAAELFEGDEQAARRWLQRPLKALGGQTALELAKTDVGTREVEALITRLEHGVLD